MLRSMLLAIAFILTGCQLAPDLPASDTGKTDWYQAGYDDAIAGAVVKDDATLAANYNDLKPDRSRYLKGYASGQKKICQPEALYARGVNGKLYPASCDGLNNAGQLREAWQRGMDQGARDALEKK
ncbi:DUF2799 domain-containing protein [Siccibacter colletis]|uniref:DUF2799 domain-containing protein n=1 Tax=Siccibacter colletis TaxID=1505757 RepID=UPI0028BD4CB1|nr:DUF2799 domain-containing protein [Siccibacter colletis]WNN47671.1 DUF2799 domain-containing protein [Siccibacter colletis]